jgi:hypothetical protein
VREGLVDLVVMVVDGRGVLKYRQTCTAEAGEWWWSKWWAMMDVVE